jgi:hypothetical protein
VYEIASPASLVRNDMYIFIPVAASQILSNSSEDIDTDISSRTPTLPLRDAMQSAAEGTNVHKGFPRLSSRQGLFDPKDLFFIQATWSRRFEQRHNYNTFQWHQEESRTGINLAGHEGQFAAIVNFCGDLRPTGLQSSN